ncbi:glycerophosphodiester phosphodiesterase [Streptomonospora nanhaiensis]|uniref:Glycerophosphoryl diester phosphodiesterase n=1 Tax=Streptomonospora nanhaiensis TaxID=1323731 RepID=A0A853BSK4_9ACTN|nr:glycerophosphodiester phosphodiesterase [Streptomonospora nanhaiensis]MBV2363703.1 glycerophosphodiester phosphodiesterase [Streptomonospora nanhaiensis]MBX9390875.1 glycerophosphodiester phosphodiesterase [Streptomonospora nanhaiensis]NYI98749.1 glycerophosphoryl diester phosphodiesterase [Streptomonospora nanhaiensis]
MTLAIALRGDTTRFRENTLPAIRSAFAEGADVVAVDLRTTADGHVVVVRDHALEYTWRLARPVSQATLADLAVLGHDVQQRIPTLMEVLAEAAGPPVRALLLDVDRLETALAAESVVGEHGMGDHIIYTGPLEVLRALRAHRPQAGLLLSWELPSLPPPDVWQSVRPRYYSTEHRLLTRELVAEIQRHGYRIATWTVDDFPEMVRLAGMGVDAIITNNIAELANLSGRQAPPGISGLPRGPHDSYSAANAPATPPYDLHPGDPRR